MMKLWRKLRDQKGFTLLELIVATGIMLIVAAGAAPMLMGHIKDPKIGNVNEQLLNVKTAFDSYFTKNQGVISDSDVDGDYLDEMLEAGWLASNPSRNGLTWTIKAHTDSGSTAYYIHITNNPDGGATPDSDGFTLLADIDGDVDTAADGADDGAAGMFRYVLKDLAPGGGDGQDDTINACYLLYQDGSISPFHSDTNDDLDCD